MSNESMNLAVYSGAILTAAIFGVVWWKWHRDDVRRDAERQAWADELLARQKRQLAQMRAARGRHPTSHHPRKPVAEYVPQPLPDEAYE